MSDPVTNVDIEDVLASIRRLVSGGADQPWPGSAHPSAAEKLVLTPSQRVDEPVAQTEPAPVEPQQEAEPLPEAEPEILENGTETAVAPAPVEDVWQDEDDAQIAAALAEAEAAFSPEPAAATETWEPDGDDEDAFAEGAAAPTLEWRDAEEREQAGQEEMFSVDPDETPADEEASRAFAHAWNEDDVGNKANASEFDLDETVLDEAALRDLVAEIVREELMGSLGERITRNVRKLVRREIYRALNCQDFD